MDVIYPLHKVWVALRHQTPVVRTKGRQLSLEYGGVWATRRGSRRVRSTHSRNVSDRGLLALLDAYSLVLFSTG